THQTLAHEYPGGEINVTLKDDLQIPIQTGADGVLNCPILDSELFTLQMGPDQFITLQAISGNVGDGTELPIIFLGRSDLYQVTHGFFNLALDVNRSTGHADTHTTVYIPLHVHISHRDVLPGSTEVLEIHPHTGGQTMTRIGYYPHIT